MELFLSSEERYSHVEKNWLDEIYSHDTYLIRRLEYSPVKFELLIEFFNPEKTNPKYIVLFRKVTSFLVVIHDIEVFEESYDYNETEDPLDFSESKKDGSTEYFMCTQARELWWKTNELPQIQFF